MLRQLSRFASTALRLQQPSNLARGLAAGLQTTSSASYAAGASTDSINAAEQTDRVDCVIVGAGVIGLACARAAALAGHEVLLLEQEPTIGTATSSRHSEVIHAGIYYPAGSLKARLCVEGKHMLYDYCSSNGNAHKRLGKLIVANHSRQLPQLKQLQQFAAANSVTDLELLTGSEAAALEPAVHCAAALLSPSTGIIDSHTYMESLLADAEASGTMLATNSQLIKVQPVPGSWAISKSAYSGSTTKQQQSTTPQRKQQHLLLDVHDTQTGAVTQLRTKWLVNAAGLQAQAVAMAVQGVPSSAIPKQYLAKGNYFSLSCKSPFNRLIYPLPEDGGLGVHLTLDLAGRAKFGPDVEWVPHVDYTVDPARAEAFYPRIRQYYPGLPDGALQASYSGIRPKLTGPGMAAGDFMLHGQDVHGVWGLINLFGIESPGLTSSLAVAQAVLQMMQ